MWYTFIAIYQFFCYSERKLHSNGGYISQNISQCMTKYSHLHQHNIKIGDNQSYHAWSVYLSLHRYYLVDYVFHATLRSGARYTSKQLVIYLR